MILAIDLGSTSFKAAIVDNRLRAHGTSSAPLQYHFAAAGHVELDVAEAERAFRKAVSAVLRATDTRATELRGIAITSQAQTFTVVGKNRRPKMRFISWQDERAGAACEMLKRSRALADFAEHGSFGSLLPALQISQIKHLQQTRPGLIQPHDIVLKLLSYFVLRLTDRAVVDDNLAAMSGLYSLVERDWWAAALATCHLTCIFHNSFDF